jgi:hypothetical protein
MGMYFNTVATIHMQDKINQLFNSGYIDWWKNHVRGMFAPLSQGGKTFPEIAGSNGVFPDDGPNSAIGKKWMDWLAELEKDVGDEFRAIFYRDLSPSGKCIEMMFTVKPKASVPITLSYQPLTVPHGNGAYSDYITINTPTVAAIRSAIRALQKKKAAKKKAAKKKKI